MSRYCRFFKTPKGCSKGEACDHRHDAQPQKVVLPPKDLRELRSSSLFEYAPTRDNERVEHDACSPHWSRVNDAAEAYSGDGPHIQMVLFNTASRHPLGVLVFGGSVCLHWMAAGCPARTCGRASCNFWHAPLGSLHSDLVRAQGTCRLMQDRKEYLSGLLRRVSSFLNQPIYELGKQHAAQLAALVDRDKKFELSAGRAMYSQILINETEADIAGTLFTSSAGESSRRRSSQWSN